MVVATPETGGKKRPELQLHQGTLTAVGLCPAWVPACAQASAHHVIVECQDRDFQVPRLLSLHVYYRVCDLSLKLNMAAPNTYSLIYHYDAIEFYLSF